MNGPVPVCTTYQLFVLFLFHRTSKSHHGRRDLNSSFNSSSVRGYQLDHRGDRWCAVQCHRFPVSAGTDLSSRGFCGSRASTYFRLVDTGIPEGTFLYYDYMLTMLHPCLIFMEAYQIRNYSYSYCYYYYYYYYYYCTGYLVHGTRIYIFICLIR